MRSTIGSFILIKNEINWIRAHLESWLPHLDEMVFFDGNSTDGTLQVLRDYASKDRKVKLFEDRDCKDLKDDYTELFDKCLKSVKSDYAFFLHPDMICDSPGTLGDIGNELAYYTHIDSFAGEPGGQLLKVSGRAERWKNIYRLRNPDLGLHYHGHYGAANEDCYFEDITGDEHEFHRQHFDRYPYRVSDAGVRILHYSDVRPYERRLSRMIQCLRAQGYSEKRIAEVAPTHPRVNLKPNEKISFEPAEYPEVFGVKA